MKPPQFSEDSTEQTLTNNDRISDSRIKGAIKWDNRDGQYVFVWWQTPFRVATENGGYSMTASLYDSIPDHISQFWIVDEKANKLRRIPRSYFEDDEVRRTIEPSDERFNNVTPEKQYAVDVSHAGEEYDLSEVDL